ncbi:MAG: carotenoid oxygenase family protein [Rubrivivax sp.]|nr:carotenoid oxygenase family protein [Rubrivivax sp.]
MQRRHFLQVLAAAAATASGTATAKPARADRFTAAFESQPLLRPFKGVGDATGDLQGRALLRGRWPTELRGRFYRNGPALFERGGERYHHWFDGDGMVQQFTIGNGEVTHRGRLVQTTKLRAELAAGRFLMSAFGTQVDGTPPVGGPDAFNTANTNALEHAGRVLALWEGGSAWALDPKDLSTQGPVTWGKDLAQVPFSAHPKVDAAGHLWNIGTFGKAMVVWHIDPAGQLVKVQVGESPYPGGMVHDMAVTARWVVVPLPPIQLQFNKPFGPDGNGVGPRPFAMDAGQPLRVLVMDKNDITKRRVFELPPQMVFHVGNAHERSDGRIVLSFIGVPDAWFLNEGAVALMQGREQADGAASSTQLLTLDMASGRVQQHRFDNDAEFPRVDPRRVGQRTRWLLTGTGWDVHASRQHHALLHGVQLLDTETGRQRRFDHGEHAIVEEHVFVPKPGKTGELDAWLLGTTFDARRQATVLNLLDAAHIEDGPIAQAVLPYLLPPGFHGNFTAA